MQLDDETIAHIRGILSRNCVVEVTVAFYDDSEKGALEPIDIGCTLELEAGAPKVEKIQEFREMLDSLVAVFEQIN